MLTTGRCSVDKFRDWQDHEWTRRRRIRRRQQQQQRKSLSTNTEMGIMKTKLTMAMLVAFATMMGIHDSSAFVLGPSSIKHTNTSPIISTRSQQSLIEYTAKSVPSCAYRERIRHRWRTSPLFATGSEDSSSNKNKKSEPNQENRKGKKKSYKGGGNQNSKKSNGVSPKQTKKSKSLTSTKSKSNNRNKNTPLDPSKQKKREIMEQIKAKIKEEGEEKKRKQKQKQNQKSNKTKKQQQQGQKQTQRQKQKQSRPKDAPTPTRLQNLADEDPPESIFEDNSDVDDYDDTNQGRKNLFVNPFQAGQSFRKTLDDLSTLGRGLQLPKETKDKYFLDDRLLDGDDELGGSPKSAGFFSSSSSLLSSNFNSKFANSLLQDYAEAEALAPTTYIPEVLVVGATGEVGRLVVRRLLLEGRGRFRVRVLVRDLYSQTLNLLGTGVSYCQGDLSDVESLEYALTDVDKIVYVAQAPKPDEADFQRKFQSYLEENDMELSITDKDGNESKNEQQQRSQQLNDREWEQLASVLEVRSELAEQVDCIGMKNLVSAYQNVRHTDYGTSQAAKRSLFKFSKKSGDYELFSLDESDDDDDDDDDTEDNDGSKGQPRYGDSYSYNNKEYDDQYDDEYDYEDEYDDEYNDENYGLELESRNARDTNVVRAQVRWLQNKFGNGVFVGMVPDADANNPRSNPGGQASITSSRMRSREDPDQGIDMSNFAGFVLRVVSDGNNYEAFVRTGLYETDGIEYVNEFSTDSKTPTADNRSRSRFKSIRLAFENFKPVQRKQKSTDEDGIVTVPPFDGSDVMHLGFRFRSSSNIPEMMEKRLELYAGRGRSYQNNRQKRFYMALAYIKVYRAQPEPEFIYLSDARIPPIIRDGMVHHQRKVLLIDDDRQHTKSKTNNNKYNNQDGRNESETSDANSSSGIATTTLLDEKDLKRKALSERSPEETYFKYRGEEILIKSGLSYTIIRVAGFNELSTSEASTIDLVKSNSETKIVPVSRAEVAQVCVSALLDPCALNKCVYMTKKTVTGKNVLDEEDISAKFEGIPTDVLL